MIEKLQTHKQKLQNLRRDISFQIKRLGIPTSDERGNEDILDIVDNQWTYFSQFKMSSRVCTLNEEQGFDINVINVMMHKDFYLPTHTHAATEKVYVLAGSYIDDTLEQEFKTGDVQIILPGIKHSSRSKNGALCTITFEPAYHTINDSIAIFPGVKL